VGEVTDEWYATAAGAINYGFPTIADTDIPEILPTGVCTYEHVVSNVPHDKIVDKCIEVRGLKIKVSEIAIPVAYSPAFEGERIRKDDMHCEFGGNRTPAFEWFNTLDSSQVEDGRIEVIGPDADSVEPGGTLSSKAPGARCKAILSRFWNVRSTRSSTRPRASGTWASEI